jgi:hypothetical protein
MPTYSYICHKCNRDEDLVRSISDYLHNPNPMFCCGRQMERWFPPGTYGKALANPLAGDRHYDGLKAPDGTDISSRTKHREYMKRNGLTTADDYTETWKKAEEQRNRYRQGEPGTGAVTRDDIARALYRHLDR